MEAYAKNVVASSAIVPTVLNELFAPLLRTLTTAEFEAAILPYGHALHMCPQA